MSANRRRLLRISIILAAFLLPIVVAMRSVFAAGQLSTISVTTSADTVDGTTSSFLALSNDPGVDAAISLREAILAAEATPIGTTLQITFDLPLSDPGYDSASGTWLIRLAYSPSARLPDLLRGDLVIDGTTQPNTTSSPAIIIDGFDVVEGPGESNGLVIQSAENAIRGLALINFYDSAIVLSSIAATDNTISNCLIGVSARGIAELPGYIGIEMRAGAADNLIGGNTVAEGNQITANLNAGILLNGADTKNNQIRQNRIGPLSGTINGNQYGIALLGGTSENEIERNTISGNTYGLYLAGASQNQVRGNLIGLNSDGQTAQPNSEGGIYLVEGASENVIGGAFTSSRNIIAANGGVGVLIANPSTNGNLIIGNYIGLAADGLTPRGNIRQGILVSLDAEENQIGGTATGEANVIVYNGLGGVRIDSDKNKAIGNIIGLAPNLTTPLGNQFNGIRINGSLNQVGSNTIAANQGSGIVSTGNQNEILANTIRENAHSGVCITGDKTTLANNIVTNNGVAGNTSEECLDTGGIVITGNNTQVHSNAIYQNNGAGVVVLEGDNNTLSTNSITANTSGIRLQNGGNIAISPPQITLVSGTAISGTACAGCTVEVFVDSGEQGRDLLGQTPADPDGTFRVSLSSPLPSGNISATLTDLLGNTSSFHVVPGLPTRTEYSINLPVVQSNEK
jgi:parallel beta-helix repeat protein